MRSTNKAESWKKVYEAFQQVNFAAWDFETVKQSLLDYLKLYFPEDFNDFIESSELIMNLEMFAYSVELIAYRLDMNAHENFISTAERKESILRLAKLLSYNPSRNIPARGLVKITSISSTERIFDSRGVDLSNKIIVWNDPNNSNWKEQFLIVLGRVLEQPFGSVAPDDRIQVQDVLFELYGLNNNPLASQTLKYSVSVSDVTYPMELVSVELNDFGPIEKRPEKNQKINILYLNDGLGDSSENTGFFFYTKQGELQKITQEYDGVTANQYTDILVDNINETDVWLNNVDSVTGEIITGDDVRVNFRQGEWERVDVANAKNIIFNTNKNRNKYEIETLANDNMRVIFGDGKFANIPSGTFDLWFRVSANQDLVIPVSAIQNTNTALNYYDANNKEQTLSLSFSLTNSIQNAAPSEDGNHIRRVAPSVYYTQDRMVNGKDYNEFLLQDNTILKINAINRTFAGDSKYIAWHDPEEYYDNVKVFGDDLVMYYQTKDITTSAAASDVPNEDGGANVALIDAIVDNYITPILETEQMYLRFIISGVDPTLVRKQFTNGERTLLEILLLALITNKPGSFYMTYTQATDAWTFDSTEPADWWITVTMNADGSWDFLNRGKTLIAHSDATDFWVSNKNQTINYDTSIVGFDEIVILKANLDVNDAVLTENKRFVAYKQDTVVAGPDAGTESKSDLVVLPIDENSDGIPDDVSLSYLIDPLTDFVYFQRELYDTGDYGPWEFREATTENVAAYTQDAADETGLWKREVGREGLNFLWLHKTPRYHLVDPASSNLIDIFLITRGYYNNIRLWLADKLDGEPERPSAFDLRESYNYLLDNKMISDSVILHTGKIKIIIGKHAPEAYRAKLKIIKSSYSTLTNNQIKSIIVDAFREFFDINYWEFGETFYFTELSTFIQSKLPADIDSIVIVPTSTGSIFGNLFEIKAAADEIIQGSIAPTDIEIIQALDSDTLKVG
jgi:hypothetical protein